MYRRDVNVNVDCTTRLVRFPYLLSESGTEWSFVVHKKSAPTDT